jgi:hypothetical protein
LTAGRSLVILSKTEREISMARYKVGDAVWVPRVGQRQVSKVCDICYGKLEVTLILGNGDTCVLPCDACRDGFEGPKGTYRTYEYVADAEVAIITSISTLTTEDGDSVGYCFNNNGCSTAEENVFATKEEALSAAGGIAIKNGIEQEKRADYIKEDKKKSYSWNAGYHLRGAKQARSSMEHHEKMAKLCKARSKEDKE